MADTSLLTPAQVRYLQRLGFGVSEIEMMWTDRVLARYMSDYAAGVEATEIVRYSETQEFGLRDAFWQSDFGQRWAAPAVEAAADVDEELAGYFDTVHETVADVYEEVGETAGEVLGALSEAAGAVWPTVKWTTIAVVGLLALGIGIGIAR